MERFLKRLLRRFGAGANGFRVIPDECAGWIGVISRMSGRPHPEDSLIAEQLLSRTNTRGERPPWGRRSDRAHNCGPFSSMPPIKSATPNGRDWGDQHRDKQGISLQRLHRGVPQQNAANPAHSTLKPDSRHQLTINAFSFATLSPNLSAKSHTACVQLSTPIRSSYVNACICDVTRA